MRKSDDSIHTALVLQGGGALGAYETGVYQEIYKHALSRRPDGNLFDIIAGTSIGAINSTVLVGHFLRNGNNWEGSAERLLEFWQGLATPTLSDLLIGSNPATRAAWDYLHSVNPNIADSETARKFWSIFEFSFTFWGVPNMFRPVPFWGSKYLNPFNDFLPWWRYDYSPLRKYLSEFVDFPIKTRPEEGEPRLLLTSVDVQDYASAVVFDSYEKFRPASDEESDGINYFTEEKGGKGWYTEYGTIEDRHVLFYDGIGPDQVLASALGKYSLNHPMMDDSVSKTRRQLWDGGYLSNTPLRELLASHRKYWSEFQAKGRRRGPSGKLTRIPQLEVYIVNLHPSTARDIPTDKDLIDNRENDILFHDRTSFDEMVAYFRTDYVTLATRLVELAEMHGLSKAVDKILASEAKSIARVGGEFRYATYRDIIDNYTNISKVWRVDRRDSSAAIFGKTTDFTFSSLYELIREGVADAKISINRMKILFEIESLIAEGVISAKDGEELMSRARKIIRAEELYKMSEPELNEARFRYVKRVEILVSDTERRRVFIEPVDSILEFLKDRSPSLKQSNTLKMFSSA